MIQVSRSKTLNQNYSAMQSRVIAKVDNALEAVGTFILSESDKKVPKDTDYLSETGRTYKEKQGLVVVGYGGTDFPMEERFSEKEGKMVKRTPAEYAVIVHQDPTQPIKAVEHDPGEALFLQNAITENIPEIREVLRESLK